jgi:hypothetical protein
MPNVIRVLNVAKEPVNAHRDSQKKAAPTARLQEKLTRRQRRHLIGDKATEDMLADAIYSTL